jgi:hypothetical protein
MAHSRAAVLASARSAAGKIAAGGDKPSTDLAGSRDLARRAGVDLRQDTGAGQFSPKSSL